MSNKMINKGSFLGENQNVKKKVLSHQNPVQKYTISHSVSRPSPLLSDKNEFPSLGENSERQPRNLSSNGGLLKYSDKVKLPSSSSSSSSFSQSSSYPSQISLTKSDCITAGTSSQVDTNTQIKYQKPLTKNKTGVDFSQTLPKKSLTENASSNQKQRHFNNKDKMKKQNNFVCTPNHRNESNKASSLITENTNLVSNSNNQNQSNKLSKSISEVSESKEEADNGETKKKKKRKSKVKRQVALQTGKITVLAPEVHSKILNQTNTHTMQNFRNFLADINDEEEYPELGKPFIPSSQREIVQKKDHFLSQKEATNKSSDATSEKKCDLSENVTEENPEIISTAETAVHENRENSDIKEKVHSYDPIKISFYDMLIEKNLKSKIKEPKEESDDAVPFAAKKVIKTKKTLCNPHNVLDSSSPAIKRGKEREKPKPKKPSQLKKIILLDRKARKEHLLQLKNNNEEINDGETKHMIHSDENEDDETCIQNSEGEDENNICNTFESNVENNKSLLLLPENEDLNLVDNLPELEHLSSGEVQENNDLFVPNNEIKIKDKAEKCTSYMSSKASTDEKDINSPQVKTNSIKDTSLGVPNSPDSLLNSLTNDNFKSETSVKEKAAKILLHTRNFREYCNHLTSKDIDDTVHALLDDLARFQDRLHQRDPVKARMKRRMIYGVKEVKKHIKLRKLKCIVLAVDIENVETQGGLNDILNDIKTSAADHHIPCVFALSRKLLGKVCHKPVSVSCIGIFNYEGSETNFKKMVELHAQSKIDYMDIFNALSTRLTEKEAELLLRAKKEAPETLRDVRANILNNIFPESKTSNMENESAITEPIEQLSNVTALEA